MDTSTLPHKNYGSVVVTVLEAIVHWLRKWVDSRPLAFSQDLHCIELFFSFSDTSSHHQTLWPPTGPSVDNSCSIATSGHWRQSLLPVSSISTCPQCVENLLAICPPSNQHQLGVVGGEGKATHSRHRKWCPRTKIDNGGIICTNITSLDIKVVISSIIFYCHVHCLMDHHTLALAKTGILASPLRKLLVLSPFQSNQGMQQVL